jgi:hypothetical protein
LAPEFFLHRLLNESASSPRPNLGVYFFDQFGWHHDVRPPLSGISNRRGSPRFQHQA